MKADAVVFTAPGQVSFQPVECPEPTSEDVLVRVAHSWISAGTEGSYLRGERIAGDTPWRPGDPSPFPAAPGYQKVGVVEFAGADVDEVRPGDMVFAAISRIEGMRRPFGGHVSPAVVPREFVWKLPTTPDPVAYSGAVLTQVGVNCGTRPEMTVGDPAVVIGDGLVGLWTAQTLAWRGADVLLVGKHDDRLARFTPGPRRRVANINDVDLDALVESWAPGGLAVVVDTAGSMPTFTSLTARARHGAHLVSAGFYGEHDGLPLQPLREPEVTVHLVSGWTRARVTQTLHLIETGEVETLGFITHRFPASRAADAWAVIRARTEPVLGVVLDWEA